MASVFDVAQYILQRIKPISGIKLQKLVYYCQAWHLAWNQGAPLFEDPIEAWINGPVVRNLYNLHRGQSRIYSLPVGDADRLTTSQKSAIQKVLDNYGKKEETWLILRSHQEAPWKDARRGLSPLEASTNEIAISSIHSFYKNKNIENCVK